MYPITTSKFIGDSGISKFDWIEVECKKVTNEKLKRKESYKVRKESINIIDTSLKQGKNKWNERNKFILKHLNSSIEDLRDSFYQDKISLGLIKPKEIIEFYKTEELEQYETNLGYQKTLSGNKVPIPTKIPHIFKYKFLCAGCKENLHDIQCEDWELLESYRKWGLKYTDPDILWEKIYEKYYKWMIERDLYFFMGTYSQYPAWMIIGLYYPPKNKKYITLDNFNGPYF